MRKHNTLFLAVCTAFCFLMTGNLSAQETEAPSEKLGNSLSLLAGLGNNLGTLPAFGFLYEKGIAEFATIGLTGGYQRYEVGFGLNDANYITGGGRISAYLLPAINSFAETELDLGGLSPYIGFSITYTLFLSDFDDLTTGATGYGAYAGARYYLTNGLGLMAEVGRSFAGINQLSVGLTFGGK